MVKNLQLRNFVLQALFYNEAGLSLPQISQLSKKSLPVVTQVVTALVDDGYVVEFGVAPSNGGRRPVVFKYDSNRKRYVISVAMDQLFTRLAIYNQNREVVYGVVVLELTPLTDKEWLSKLIRFIDDHLKQSGVERTLIWGLGIGMPGFVNPEKGINRSFYDPEEKNIKEVISEELKVPVFIDNDSSIIALAELKLGVARDCREMMVVNLGWGTGLGIVINGEQYKGHSGYAGEFSHIPLADNQRLCSCGKRGCLEVETSLLAMVERVKQAIASGTVSQFSELARQAGKSDVDILIEAALRGDSLVISVLSQAAFILGKGIATLIHIMNPEKVVLSGRGSVVGKIFQPGIQQALNVFCLPSIAEETDIVISTFGEDAELIGAACYVVENCTFY